jgi:hypothetical protein
MTIVKSFMLVMWLYLSYCRYLMWTWLKIFNVWDLISKWVILNHFLWFEILECIVFWCFAIFLDYVSFFYTWCFDFPYVFWVLIFALLQVSHVLVWRLCTFWEGCYVIKFIWTTLVVGVDMVTHDNVNAWSFDV